MTRRMGTQTFHVHAGWRVLLKDLDINAGNVLRRAELPADLLVRDRAQLTCSEYFRLWRAVEAEAGDPMLPVRIGSAISVEAFDPLVFGALCSPDYNTALTRIAQFKRLCSPVQLIVDIAPTATRLTIQFPGDEEVPPGLIAAELVFFVEIARIATRHPLQPIRIEAPIALGPHDEFARYFGSVPLRGPRIALTFSTEDATRPFLTSNESIWRSFEPDLQARLSEIEQSVSIEERVRAVLHELLPSGSAAMADVAAKLGLSTRSLQRRLQERGASFQGVLQATRSRLATHYLRNSRLAGGEIAFLLGFDDPGSFSRAFHAWTGSTPEQMRAALNRRTLPS